MKEKKDNSSSSPPSFFKHEYEDYDAPISFYISCDVCGLKVPDDEPLFNPIGDPNWYCKHCWEDKQRKQEEEQNHNNNWWWYDRQYCKLCDDVTDHMIQVEEDPIIGTILKRKYGFKKICVEHSFVDEDEINLMYFRAYITGLRRPLYIGIDTAKMKNIKLKTMYE